MAEVNVHVFHFAGIDSLAGFGIGLIWEAQMNAACHGERAIELGTGGGAGEDADLKLLATEVGFRDPARQLHWDSLGIARASEAAHSDLIAGMNQSRSFVGAHDLLRQAGIQYTRGRGGWESNRHRASLSNSTK